MQRAFSADGVIGECGVRRGEMLAGENEAELSGWEMGTQGKERFEG